MVSPRWRSGGGLVPGALVPLALACLGGTLYVASIPTAGLYPLAWICLTPPLTYLLLRDPRAVSTHQAATMGLVFGLICGLGRVYWIAETLESYGGLGPTMATITTGLLIGYLALYPACFFALVSRVARTVDASWGESAAPVRPHHRAALFPWLIAAAWVALEWVQGWLFTGFPWQLLGYSAQGDLPLIQVASVTGVYGVSFVLAAANAGIALVAVSVWRRRTLAGMALVAGPVLALVAGAYLYGSLRLETLNSARDRLLRVGIVQGNISQDQKWRANRKTAATTGLYIDLTHQLIEAHPDVDLVIYPETALPYYFTDAAYAPYADQVRELARQIEKPILVGSLQGDSQEWDGVIYNRAFMLDAAGTVQGHADKVHLVPFGEYLPMAWLFAYLEGLTAESGRFTHGEDYRTVPVPGGDTPLGIFICYESIFPEIPRILTRMGAQILVNTTNDAWFGTTSAPHQHFSMAAMRAVETGRSVVRAANTGISGAILPSGAILAATPLFTTTVLAVDVPARSEVTPYVRWGDVLIWACLAVLLTWIALEVESRRSGRV